MSRRCSSNRPSSSGGQSLAQKPAWSFQLPPMHHADCSVLRATGHSRRAPAGPPERACAGVNRACARSDVRTAVEARSVHSSHQPFAESVALRSTSNDLTFHGEFGRLGRRVIFRRLRWTRGRHACPKRSVGRARKDNDARNKRENAGGVREGAQGDREACEDIRKRLLRPPKHAKAGLSRRTRPGGGVRLAVCGANVKRCRLNAVLMCAMKLGKM